MKLGWLWALAPLAALLVFGPTLGHELLAWDDRVHTVENLHIADTGYFWNNFEQGMYMPVTFSLWSLVYRVFGDSAAAFHALNVLLHAVNAALCYRLLLALQELDERPPSQVASAFGALLFALHPLQVESVSWVTSLKDVGCTTFALAALWAHVASRRWLAVGALVVAGLCKPAAVAVLPVLVVIDLCFRRLAPRQVFFSVLPFALAILPSTVLNVVSQSKLTLLYETPLPFRPLVALDSVAFYAKKIVAPWQLLPAYERSPRWLIESGRIWYSWLPGAVLLGVIAATRGSLPNLWRSALLCLAAVSPVLGLKPFAAQDNSTIYDHYLYLAMLGPAWGVTVLARRTLVERRVLALLLAVFAAKSVVQSRAWKDDETLWTFTLTRKGDAAVALVSLASVRSKQGRHDEAVGMLQHAINSRPFDVQAFNNLGVELARVGQIDQAGPLFARAVELDPKNVSSLDNLSRAELHAGKLGPAERTLRQLLAVAPRHRQALLGLGEVLLATDRVGECIEHARRMVADAPNDHEALTLLGVAEARAGQRQAAIVHFQRALAVAPGYALARQNLELAQRETVPP